MYVFQTVSETPSAAIRLPDASFRHQLHLQAATVTGVQMTTVNAMVSIGSIMFSSLNTPSPFLSENNSSIPVMSSHKYLPIWK